MDTWGHLLPNANICHVIQKFSDIRYEVEVTFASCIIRFFLYDVCFLRAPDSTRYHMCTYAKLPVLSVVLTSG